LHDLYPASFSLKLFAPQSFLLKLFVSKSLIAFLHNHIKR